jgi:hypothetical protein
MLINFFQKIVFCSGIIYLDRFIAQNEAYLKKDKCLVALRFKLGAVGNIYYLSIGSKKYSKEQLQVFSSGKVCKINNYIQIYQYGSATRRIMKLKQDKGFKND